MKNHKIWEKEVFHKYGTANVRKFIEEVSVGEIPTGCFQLVWEVDFVCKGDEIGCGLANGDWDIVFKTYGLSCSTPLQSKKIEDFYKNEGKKSFYNDDDSVIAFLLQQIVFQIDKTGFFMNKDGNMQLKKNEAV